MFDETSKNPSEVKVKTLVWVITTLYLTTGLTGAAIIVLASFLLGSVGVPNFPGMVRETIFFLVLVGGYVLAFKIGINFVLKRAVIKKKYFKVIIFSVLGLIGIVQLWRGGLSVGSLLTIGLLLLIFYIFGNYWLSRKAREQLSKLQVSEEQLPDLRITTRQEAIGIFILILVVGGAAIIRNVLPSEFESQKESQKIDAEVRDISRKSDLIALDQGIYCYRNSGNWKFPPFLEGLSSHDFALCFSGEFPRRDPVTDKFYEYWVSPDQQKFILRAIFETHDPDLDNDIDGWPLGEGAVDCGSQGLNEREYCVGGGF